MESIVPLVDERQSVVEKVVSRGGRVAPQWEAAWDVSRQRWYFADRANGVTSWKRPSGCQIGLPAAPPPLVREATRAAATKVQPREQGNRIADLPDDWEAAWAQTHGAFYYFNRATGERTWKKPSRETKRSGLWSLLCRLIFKPRQRQTLDGRCMGGSTEEAAETDQKTHPEPVTLSTPKSTPSAAPAPLSQSESTPSAGPGPPPKTSSEEPATAAEKTRDGDIKDATDGVAPKAHSADMAVDALLNELLCGLKSPIKACVIALPQEHAASLQQPEQVEAECHSLYIQERKRDAASDADVRFSTTEPSAAEATKRSDNGDARDGVDLDTGLAADAADRRTHSEPSALPIPTSSPSAASAPRLDDTADHSLEDGAAEAETTRDNDPQDLIDDIDRAASPESLELDSILDELLHGKGCEITAPEERAASLEQLEQLLSECLRRCVQEHWLRCRPEGAGGNRLAAGHSAADMHKVVQRFLKPLTRERRCSYVEVVATSPQPAMWFVSHWWGEPFQDTMACLRTQSADRQHSVDTAYWLAATAVRHWEPEPTDLCSSGGASGGVFARPLSSVADSLAARVMRRCKGTVWIIDRDASCFARAWCCWEVWTALLVQQSAADGSQQQGSEKLLLDVYSAAGCPAALGPGGGVLGDAGPAAVGLVDGFAAVDMAGAEDVTASSSVAAAAWRAKCLREGRFPLAIMKLALGLKMHDSKASSSAERDYIMDGLLTGFANEAEAEDRDACTLKLAQSSVDSTLRARLFTHGTMWRQLLQSGAYLPAYGTTLQTSRLSSVAMCVGFCDAFVDASLAELAVTLREGSIRLRSLQLCMAESQVSDAGVQALCESLPASLEVLILDLGGCSKLGGETIQHLATLLRDRQLKLRQLALELGGCRSCLADGGGFMFRLFRALPDTLRSLDLGLADGSRLTEMRLELLPPSLRSLRMDFRRCKKLGDGVVANFVGVLPASLQHLEVNFHACGGVTNQSALSLGTALPRFLETLHVDFSGCPDLSTDLAVRPLAANLPRSLDKLVLNFQSCPKVVCDADTAEAIVRKVLEDCPTEITFLA
eukprot:TRINITY_DN1376_c0_g1_i1.p1 TRINITY_DN1376_c0_g1~~TRINITY_DN1376_c0_g1_i1.p1  ORF type:complete len:1061 (+),score=153.06 TRINITY_DN1376_c0_g1_i1:81-3263(+)